MINGDIGLQEKIYSNRTEYFINKKYYTSDCDDDNLVSLIKLVNEIILNYDVMKDFIESDIFCCDQCSTLNIDPDNECDFCHIKLCDNCASGSDVSFHNCEECKTKW